MLRKVFDHIHMTCNSALHIESPSAKHILTGLDILHDFLRYVQGFKYLRKLIGVKGSLSVYSKIVDTYCVQMTHKDNSPIRVTLCASYHSNGVVSFDLVIYSLLKHYLLRVLFEVFKTQIIIVDPSCHVAFAAGFHYARDPHQLFCKVFYCL